MTQKTIKEVSSTELENHVNKLFSIEAKLQSIERVEEFFNGQLVWNGQVHVFKLIGHDKADICFAWSSPLEGSKSRKFYAVLKIPPIETAKDAVRASIVADYQSKK